VAEDAAAAAPSRPSAAAACATPPQEHHVTEPLVSSDGGSSPHRATARSRLSAASSPYPLVSSVGGSCAARSPRLQSYITGSELAAGATAYLLRFFAVAAPGNAPEVNDFAEWLAAKLRRAETFPGLHIVRRGREAGSSVAACVAAGILSLSWSFVHSQGLLWSEEITSGTHKWKQLSENEQAANAACCTFTRIAVGAATRLEIMYRLPSVTSMLLTVLGTSTSIGDAPWKTYTSTYTQRIRTTRLDDVPLRIEARKRAQDGTRRSYDWGGEKEDI
jgi:hypothetical protein